MAVATALVDLELGPDHLIDVVLLQWWTSFGDANGAFGVIPQSLVDQKARELNLLDAWLREFDQTTPIRPLFIATPEVSMPRSLLEIVEQMISRLRRPTVVIAGLSHLTWTEYEQLLADCPNMPHTVNWRDGSNANQMVNAAAVLIHSGVMGAEVVRYVQSKIHPFSEEQPQLFRGMHSLLFRSRNQNSGSSLNFAVKICSDFVSPEIVSSFRREVEAAAPSVRLDFTFVLQFQPDPEAQQFKAGVQAYFQPPMGMANTNEGAVLLLNTASETRGRSAVFGGSRLNVKYEQRYRMAKTVASPTCIRTDEGEFGYQALVLRDSGPSVYLLTFKPIYLVTRAPGSGGEQPFQRCDCAHLDGSITELEFQPLQPVCHWLENEWRGDETPFIDFSISHSGNSSPNQTEASTNRRASYRDFLRDVHRRGRTLWDSSMRDRETEARDTICTYAIVLSGDEGGPQKEAEPVRWNPEISEAAKKFMRVLSLFSLGLVDETQLLIPSSRLRIRHAMIGQSMALTFLWGAGRSPINVLSKFRQYSIETALGEIRQCAWIVVVIGTSCDLTEAEFSDWRDSSVTEDRESDHGQRRLGDVVRADMSFNVIWATGLHRCLNNTHDGQSLRSKLQSFLAPILQ